MMLTKQCAVRVTPNSRICPKAPLLVPVQHLQQQLRFRPSLHHKQDLCKPVASTASNAAPTPDDAAKPAVPAPAAAAAAAAPAPRSMDWLKVAVLGSMFLISCFNYTILQSLKDALIVTEVGAEALPFLGAYGVFPGSIAFYMYYGWVTKNLPEKLHYYAALTPFLVFYAAFAAVLYPMAPLLHPYYLLDSIKAMLPNGLVGLAGVLVNWLYSLFFIVGELWGGVAISMLFWGLANDVCSMQEAKDVYAFLGIIANVGLIAAGAWVKFINADSFSGGSALLSMRWLVGSVVGSSVILFMLKAVVDKKYLAEAHANAEKKEKKPKKDKKSKDAGAMSSAMELIKGSPKVGNLAVLVTAYFVVQKFFDFAWKAQMRVFYPSNTEFQSALASVSQMTGIATILMMATSKYAFKYLGWGGAALVTPVAILLLGGAFFGAAIISQYPHLSGPTIAALILPIGAAAGIAGRVLSKASKYSLFDPAKEMVFITMTKKEKTEGKAAVDLLGSYFGKSGASILMQVMILVFGTLNNSMPIIFAVHVAVCAAWTKSTVTLSGLMKKSEDEESASATQIKLAAAGVELSSAAVAKSAATPAAAQSSVMSIDEAGGSMDETDSEVPSSASSTSGSVGQEGKGKMPL